MLLLVEYVYGTPKSLNNKLIPNCVFLPRDATNSAFIVRLLSSVCPSVCPSVTFSYRDYTGWNTSKIISRPNSLRIMQSLTPTRAIWFNGNNPKIRWNRVGWITRIRTTYRRLAILETNCTGNSPNTISPNNIFARRSPKAIHLDPGKHGENFEETKGRVGRSGAQKQQYL